MRMANVYVNTFIFLPDPYVPVFVIKNVFFFYMCTYI